MVHKTLVFTSVIDRWSTCVTDQSCYKLLNGFSMACQSNHTQPKQALLTLHGVHGVSYRVILSNGKPHPTHPIRGGGRVGPRGLGADTYMCREHFKIWSEGRFMTIFGCRTHFLIITHNVFLTKLSISCRQRLLNLAWGFHPKHYRWVQTKTPATLDSKVKHMFEK